MERMKNSHDDESMFWRMLEKNRLVDLSQFHKADFYEEVPLCSRIEDIAFLADYSADDASFKLLRFALKFLKSVVSYEQHDAPYFAAITVAEISPGDPIIPSLFVWFRPILDLFEQLKLSEPATPFGRKIKRFVAQLDLPDRHEVFEDLLTVPDSPREFIAPSLPPYRGFVPVYTFCKPGRPARKTHPSYRK